MFVEQFIIPYCKMVQYHHNTFQKHYLRLHWIFLYNMGSLQRITLLFFLHNPGFIIILLL
jgi:hypothetical protein